MAYPTLPRQWAGCLHTCLLWLAALLLPIPAIAQASTEEAPRYTRIQAGHSAMWYDPARSGEGWMLEILPDDGAVVYWFTFDDEGKPRWLGGNGTIVRSDAGDELQFESLYAAHGPRFGPEFDPADAVREDVGSAIFRFQDCNSGEIAFDAYGKQRTFPLTRLTRTMGANGCRPIHGTPGEPIQPYAGQSGSWYDPASSGQGFTLAWLANGDAALVWFTFDNEGKPYWMTAIGKPEDERIVFPELLSVQGGRFAEAFDPEAVTRTPWGRMELALECDAGQASYFPAEEGFAEGQLDLQRLTRLESPACPWVKPKLTDLYDLEWTELPVPAYTTPMNPVHFEMRSIADDGTVLGGGRWDGWAGIVRLRPGETEWEKMLEGAGEPFVTPDGKTIYASRNEPPPPEATNIVSARKLMMWREATGWQTLPGITNVTNVTYGMSQNGKWLVGTGRMGNGDLTNQWKWSEETGQVILPNEFFAPLPLSISDDGEIIVGAARAIPAWQTRRAVQWTSGEQHYLWDNDGNVLGNARACNADCSRVAGYYQNPVSVLTPDSLRAWYRELSGAVTYLDMPEGATDNNVTAINSAGDLIAGVQSIWEQARSRFIVEGWLWTQDTGSVSLRNILEGDGEFQFTGRWRRNVMDVSSDGTRILLSGWTLVPNGQLQQYRAGVLRLIPKASQDVNSNPQETSK